VASAAGLGLTSLQNFVCCLGCVFEVGDKGAAHISHMYNCTEHLGCLWLAGLLASKNSISALDTNIIRIAGDRLSLVSESQRSSGAESRPTQPNLSGDLASSQGPRYM